MLNQQENKKISRKELKTITGGIMPIEEGCNYIENGQYIDGCPQGQKCRIKKLSHDPLIFGYACVH